MTKLQCLLARKCLGLTCAGLAKKIGVNQSTIYRIERSGSKELSDEMFKKIETFFLANKIVFLKNCIMYGEECNRD